MKTVPGVKKIIAVASGKGGVGKSTTAVNLALALSAEGNQVGLLDADIYGPNQPHLLGVPNARPEVLNENRLVPIMAHGLQTMSIGYLIDAGTPMIWRGPMVTSALQQLLYDTQWNDLDYLVLDLPPGTGDIQLTLAQKIPVNGAVVVTTPQDIALLDVQKAIAMFQRVQVPILGIIENMSTHICSHCGHEEKLFGEGGGKNLAQQYQTTLLGKVPLDIKIRERSDDGEPIVVAEPEHMISKTYHEISKLIIQKLKEQKDYASKFPKIVIENK